MANSRKDYYYARAQDIFILTIPKKLSYLENLQDPLKRFAGMSYLENVQEMRRNHDLTEVNMPDNQVCCLIQE